MKRLKIHVSVVRFRPRPPVNPSVIRGVFGFQKYSNKVKYMPIVGTLSVGTLVIMIPGKVVNELAYSRYDDLEDGIGLN